MIAIGKRDRVIAFERLTVSRTTLGGKPEAAGTWAELGTRLASVLFGSGAERRAAAVEQAVQPATFRVLADELTTTITVKDRITHLGLSWDIASITPIGRRPDEIEFTATASRD
jgi:head-tail adaptor